MCYINEWSMQQTHSGLRRRCLTPPCICFRWFPGLAVGLDPEGYGNPDFCWLSMYDTLVWSLAGPVAVAVAVRQQQQIFVVMGFLCSPVMQSERCVPQMNVFLCVLSSRASCSPRHRSLEKKEPRV